MSTPLTGTVIITGGNGLLGSEIAIEIAKKQPFVHLLLTARDIRTDDVRELMGKIRLIGPRSIEVLALDLTDLKSVASFAKATVDRVRFRDIPPVTSLIHSAVATSYAVDDLTSDGYDPVYQTNCLSPFLLTIGLLEAFRAGDGTPKGGAKVINIGCSATSSGRLDYFDRDHGRNGRRPGTALSAKEGNLRFGSSKLMGSVALYALRRSLIWVSCHFDRAYLPICSADFSSSLIGPNYRPEIYRLTSSPWTQEVSLARAICGPGRPCRSESHTRLGPGFGHSCAWYPEAP
jgi:mannan polymerase II complex ANP1 subunit